MARVLPFRGLRYSPDLAPCLPRLVTPPYDIISPAEQRKFYRAHPANIIRLELGTTRPQDGPRSNRYTRARATLDAWVEHGILRRETRPGFYLLQTRYRDPSGRSRAFTGLLGRVKLEPFGRGPIYPHERTFRGPKLDRLKLLRATGVNLSPVLALYRDPRRAITRLLQAQTRRRPELDFSDWAGNRQRLWVVTEPKLLRELQARFHSKPLLIADGHHRYSTALQYRDRQRRRGETGAGIESVLMCLAETRDPGLAVLPVYRLLSGIPPAAWARWRRACSQIFEIRAMPSLERLAAAHRQALAKPGPLTLGCLGGFGRGIFLLRLRSGRPQALTADLMPDASRWLQGLDLVVIDQFMLRHLLGIPAGEEARRVRYTKDLRLAHREVVAGRAQAALLPGTPDPDRIWRVALNGETMPQKSTYFLPKIITGLVMNPVRYPGPGCD